MPHPDLKNNTAFAYESLFITDEEGRPLFVPLVQGTYAIQPDGSLSLLEKQPPINIAGQWHGDPMVTSIRLEPQIAFNKLATDIVLLGHAYPATRGAVEGHVGIRVGPVQKLARVYGDRRLVRRLGVAVITTPEPFDRIPIVYERCFGGWDRRDKNPEKHTCEPRNPVGVGFCDESIGADDELPLPNFEDPDRHYRGYGDTPPPAGFGFIGANWQPRVAFAGTYNAEWDKIRKPLLPKDFDRRFFNAASPGLIAPGYLRGNEQVVVVGAAPEGKVVFDLPGAPAPFCLVEVRGKNRVRLDTVLDTVIVDMDARQLTLIWRAHLAVRNGPHDILSIALSPDPEAPDADE